jgi:hypothetical protein
MAHLSSSIKPLRMISPSPVSRVRPFGSLPPIVRFLREDDIPALLELESRQWDAVQAADEPTLRDRIRACPDLSIGAFCPGTGRALASLFLRPVSLDDIMDARTWSDCASGSPPPRENDRTDKLFGISFTSVDPQAASSVFSFFWPYALKRGWRDIYLGSPIPGLQQALASEPSLTARVYARSRRRGVPRDPQLRYYHRKGFRDIVAVKPGYFPHHRSLDHGVVLRGRVPLSSGRLLWRILPLGITQALLRVAAAAFHTPGSRYSTV